MAYCTRDDVFNLGLTAQAFVTRPRPVTAADVDITTGVVRLEAHGLTGEDTVTVRVTGGGTLPPELSAFTAYTVAPVSFDLLRLVDNGTPITAFTATGGGWSVSVDPGRRLDQHIADAATIIDDKLTAHAPPVILTPGLESILRGLNARLAAMAAVNSLAFENASYRVPVDRLEAMLARDWDNLKTYLDGRPLNPRPEDQTDIPDNSARAAATRPPVAWQSGTL